jgi:hypothetical protein
MFTRGVSKGPQYVCWNEFSAHQCCAWVILCEHNAINNVVVHVHSSLLECTRIIFSGTRTWFGIELASIGWRIDSHLMGGGRRFNLYHPILLYPLRRNRFAIEHCPFIDDLEHFLKTITYQQWWISIAMLLYWWVNTSKKLCQYHDISW